MTDGRTRISDALSDYLDDLTRPVGPRVPTGIAALDDALGGGLQRGKLTVVVGQIGSGRSALATQTAIHAAATGVPTFTVLPRLDPRSFAARAIAARVDVDVDAAMERRLPEEEEARAREVVEQYDGWPLTITMGDEVPTVERARDVEAAQAVEGGPRPNLVVVDELQHLQATAWESSPSDMAEEIAVDLFRWAKEQECAVLAVSSSSDVDTRECAIAQTVIRLVRDGDRVEATVCDADDNRTTVALEWRKKSASFAP